MEARSLQSFSIEKARELQRHLSGRVIRRDCLPEHLQYVAGVDVAYANKFSIGAVAVFDYGSMNLIEKKTSKQVTRFPYVPTLLSFRELSPSVSAIRKLRTEPDLFLVDGQGLAHPYRLGFASHIGLVLDAPTIGVAKSLLCGEVKEDGEEGIWKSIIHEGEIVGAAVTIKPGAKPVYVSIGHKISLETAIKVVLHCAKGHRIPEPLRETHLIAEELKRKIVGDKSSKSKL